MKIFAISDIHGALRPIENALSYIRDADLVTISGDISKSGTKEDAAAVIETIESHNRNILAVHGNMDHQEVKELLEQKGYNLHADGKIVDGIGFFGVGGSTKTPMSTRCEYSEEEIGVFIDQGYNKIKEMRTAVLISHAPPYGTRDRSFFGLRGGSKRIARFVREHAIRLCLVGHIHEANGVEKLDQTIVANPGSFRRGRFLSVELGDEIHIEAGRIAS
ncbi:MAG: metallophosphoesterase family protein [Deltaproteobacteria bacterium]|nr:metallophosphoesterase family protein [Deltaproteobacteria bacterium]